MSRCLSRCIENFLAPIAANCVVVRIVTSYVAHLAFWPSLSKTPGTSSREALAEAEAVVAEFASRILFKICKFLLQLFNFLGDEFQRQDSLLEPSASQLAVVLQ